MKDYKNDSTSVLTRFGRDKRARTVTATTERVERRPHSQRDAADSERPSHEGKPAERASYNPNFTAENRPAFDKPHRDDARPQRTYGDRERNFGDKPAYGQRTYGDKPRTYGDRERNFGDKPAYGQRTYGDKPRTYGDRERNFGDESRPFENRTSDDRPRRSYGDKPAYGDRKQGPKRFGDRKPGNRKFEDRNYGDRKFGAKPAYKKRDEKPASYPKYNPDKQIGEMRLNRFIAQSGICSRREADEFILAGLVSVNGTIVTELGTKVMPTDEVKFNDSRVQGEKKVYLVLNKPKGYVTSLDDPHAGKTVMELVEGACTERIYPVGRLDKNSLGLLLFTNDGDLTKQLTHPSYKKKKIYQVTLDKPLTRADMDRLAEGIALEDGEIFADEISYVKENKQEVGVEIHSGRNRIVRRMFEFLGYTVTKLDRVYYAGLTKKKLNRGKWRFLTDEEVQRLKSGQYE
jgi:23S rRNA pseudouridine2605 synthase